MRRALAGALFAVIVAGARPASAAGALETLAPQVAKPLGAVPAGAVVIASPLVSDQPAPKGDELSARVAALVAGSLGGTTRAHPQAAALSVARAVAGRGGALVYLQVELAKGELRVTADVYPVMSNGWDRIRVPAPPPRAHAFASVAIDAEVRTFLPSLTLERAEIHKAKHDEGDVLAAACGDVDGDGGMELLLVSRARVALGHLVGGKFAPVKTAMWSALAPRAGVPLRDPLGGAVIDPRSPRAILVGTTDRGGMALDASLRPLGPLRGMPVAIGLTSDACATVSPEQSAFEGDVTACALVAGARDPEVRATPPVARFDALVGLDLIAPSGVSHPAFAAREPSGRLRVRVADAVYTMDGVGAQVAVGDLDQDGQLDIATSALEGDDAIAVVSWSPASGDAKPRLKIPAPGGVRALAVCPPEERGAPALVAIVGGEVWIVR